MPLIVFATRRARSVAGGIAFITLYGTSTDLSEGPSYDDPPLVSFLLNCMY